MKNRKVKRCPYRQATEKDKQNLGDQALLDRETAGKQEGRMD